MKKSILVLTIIFFTAQAYADQSSQSVSKNEESTKVLGSPWAEKVIEVRGLVGSDEKLKESVGIETLSNAVTPILKQGARTPLSIPLKLGAAQSCEGCAKVRLYRMGKEPTEKPTEIGFYAINGFTHLQKNQPAVIVDLQISANSKITLRALPFQHADELSFVDANDMPKPVKIIPKEEKKTEVETAEVLAKNEVPVDSSKKTAAEAKVSEEKKDVAAPDKAESKTVIVKAVVLGEVNAAKSSSELTPKPESVKQNGM